MPKTVTLSNDEIVQFKECFTHKAEKAYYEALNKDAVEKEYLEKGETVREYPVTNVSHAIEAAVLAMVESVKRGETQIDPTVAWLEGLSEQDYAHLVTTMTDIRREGREKGKKNR